MPLRVTGNVSLQDHKSHDNHPMRKRFSAHSQDTSSLRHVHPDISHRDGSETGLRRHTPPSAACDGNVARCPLALMPPAQVGVTVFGTISDTWTPYMRSRKCYCLHVPQSSTGSGPPQPAIASILFASPMTFAAPAVYCGRTSKGAKPSILRPVTLS